MFEDGAKEFKLKSGIIMKSVSKQGLKFLSTLLPSLYGADKTNSYCMEHIWTIYLEKERSWLFLHIGLMGKMVAPPPWLVHIGFVGKVVVLPLCCDPSCWLVVLCFLISPSAHLDYGRLTLFLWRLHFIVFIFYDHFTIGTLP